MFSHPLLLLPPSNATAGVTGGEKALSSSSGDHISPRLEPNPLSHQAVLQLSPGLENGINGISPNDLQARELKFRLTYDEYYRDDLVAKCRRTFGPRIGGALVSRLKALPGWSTLFPPASANSTEEGADLPCKPSTTLFLWYSLLVTTTTFFLSVFLKGVFIDPVVRLMRSRLAIVAYGLVAMNSWETVLALLSRV